MWPSFGKCSCLSTSCSAWIRGICRIPRCSWAPSMCIYVLQFLVSPWAVYLPPGSVVIRAAVLSQSLGSVPASRFLATSTLVAPLHAVHRPFCYQATSHCKGQPFAAYGLSWCSANALTAWVSVKWLSPLDTPATGLLQRSPMCTTGPYPSLSLTLPGSFRQCSGVTPPSLGQEQLTDARSVPPPPSLGQEQLTDARSVPAASSGRAPISGLLTVLSHFPVYNCWSFGPCLDLIPRLRMDSNFCHHETLAAMAATRVSPAYHCLHCV